MDLHTNNYIIPICYTIEFSYIFLIFSKNWLVPAYYDEARRHMILRCSLNTLSSLLVRIHCAQHWVVSVAR